MQESRMTMRANAVSGSRCVLELSADLRRWAPAATNTAVGGHVQFSVAIERAVTGRFFRVRGVSQ